MAGALAETFTGGRQGVGAARYHCKEEMGAAVCSGRVRPEAVVGPSWRGDVARETQLSIQVRVSPANGKRDSGSQLLVVASDPRRVLPEASPHTLGR